MGAANTFDSSNPSMRNDCDVKNKWWKVRTKIVATNIIASYQLLSISRRVQSCVQLVQAGHISQVSTIASYEENIKATLRE